MFNRKLKAEVAALKKQIDGLKQYHDVGFAGYYGFYRSADYKMFQEEIQKINLKIDSLAHVAGYSLKYTPATPEITKWIKNDSSTSSTSNKS